MFNEKRIRIITGHYGSGKTEFAVNYALRLAKTGKKVAIVDLDIVNPYFRSGDIREDLEKQGVRVVASGAQYRSNDVPALPPDIYGVIQSDEYEVILDVGGDPAGARTLARYQKYFTEDNYDMLFVVNANRPYTSNAKDVIEYIHNIEDSAKAKATKLVNNTHLLRDTTAEEILKGQHVVEEVSKQTGLPIAYVSGIKSALEQAAPDIKQGELFEIDMVMRPEWL
jgi:hypothetical protein